MESTIDLILKGHFDTLKERVNNNSVKSQRAEDLKTLLKDVVDYLEQTGDKKAAELRKRLVELMSEDSFSSEVLFDLGKKPMQKAGKKKSTKDQRKAM